MYLSEYSLQDINDFKYITGDSVYFKRMNSKEWYGPARVIEQDSQRVLVRNDSTYIKLHPCRCQLTHKNSNNQQELTSQENITTNQTPIYVLDVLVN